MIIKFNIIDKEGKKNTIGSEEGITIRDAVMEKLAPSMFGLCGGNCICATCHIYVDKKDFNKLPKADENEVETMQTNDVVLTQYSRLACQIELKKDYNNITVSIV
jgi:2Fe-2S ferredoxin